MSDKEYITKIKIDGRDYYLRDERVDNLDELNEINLENGSGEGSVVQKGTEASYDHQFIAGKWNENKENTLFEVGNGSENSRSNALEVLRDGRVKAYGTPSEDNDLVSKKYVDDKHKDAIEVAQGKTKTYVLSTKATSNEHLLYNSIFASENVFIGGDDEKAELLLVDGTIVSITDLKVGDIILVTDLEYPDRYMINYTHGFYFYPLESRKISLDDYALKSSLDELSRYTYNNVSNLGNVKVDKTTTVNGHALSSNISITKADIDLGNVDNTSDLDKPVSNATQGLINDLSSLINTNKENIDKIEKVLTSDDTDLDTLQELVNALKNNTSNINDIFTQVSKKVDKTTTVNGHSLSSNVTITKEDIGLNNVLDVASYSKTETDALLLPKANRTEIPTKLSDLTNDKGFIDDSNVVTLNGNQTISGIKNFQDNIDFNGDEIDFYGNLVNFMKQVVFYGDTHVTQTPTSPSHAVSKDYVDKEIKNSIPVFDTIKDFQDYLVELPELSLKNGQLFIVDNFPIHAMYVMPWFQYSAEYHSYEGFIKELFSEGVNVGYYKIYPLESKNIQIVEADLEDIYDPNVVDIQTRAGVYATDPNTDAAKLIFNRSGNLTFKQTILDLDKKQIVTRTPDGTGLASTSIYSLVSEGHMQAVAEDTKAYVDQKIEEAIFKALNTEV